MPAQRELTLGAGWPHRPQREISRARGCPLNACALIGACSKPSHRQNRLGTDIDSASCPRGDRIGALFAAVQESANGPKRTCSSSVAMSAFGGKADIEI
jgi:hypothetical protein